MLDVRSPEEFARGHLRGSVNVGLDGRFAEYAAQVVGGDIVVVCDPGRARDTRLRLARVGLDSVVGALDQPASAFVEHPEATGTASRLTARQLADARAAVPGLVLLDVRGPGEREMGCIEDSVHIPLGQLRDRVGRARPGPPGRHVLRRRLPVLDRGQPAPRLGLRRRVRPHRRLPGVAGGLTLTAPPRPAVGSGVLSFVVTARGRHRGARATRQGAKMPHPIVHAEIRSSDPDATRTFFADLLGWTYPDHGAVPGYAFVDTGVPGALYTAISPLQGGSELVTFFIAVDDIEAP